MGYLPHQLVSHRCLLGPRYFCLRSGLSTPLSHTHVRPLSAFEGPGPAQMTWVCLVVQHACPAAENSLLGSASTIFSRVTNNILVTGLNSSWKRKTGVPGVQGAPGKCSSTKASVTWPSSSPVTKCCRSASDQACPRTPVSVHGARGRTTAWPSLTLLGARLASYEMLTGLCEAENQYIYCFLGLGFTWHWSISN